MRHLFALAVFNLVILSALPAAALAVPKPLPRPVFKSQQPPPVKAASAAETVRVEERHAHSLEGQIFRLKKNDDRLSDEDAARYAHIFSFQEVGDFSRANEEIARLKDHRLMGHVLYQRYMAPGYKATFKELSDWMRDFGDHPGAQKIYDLAQSRGVAKGTALAEPRTGKGMSGYHDYDSGQLAQPYMAEKEKTSRMRAIIDDVAKHLSDRPTVALKRLENKDARTAFSGTEQDVLRARVAESYFYNDKVEKAGALAGAAAERSGTDAPLAGWIAGLSSWRQGKYGEAAKYFEKTALSPRASAWLSAGAAHWAARSHLRNRQPQNVGKWLQLAAMHPRSFYGIISAKALGMEQSRFSWQMPELTAKMIKTLARLPEGRRALALMDAGRPLWMERELRLIDASDDIHLQEAMMALANKAGAPALMMRLGSVLKDKNDNLYDGALYPDAPWQPEGGYFIDRALVHAFIRQESKFDSDATNKNSGASGIMQILPSTAEIVAKRHGINIDNDRLNEPGVNIRLGQKYLADLLKDGNVRNNLFKLAVAYNAGPGKLARWEKEVAYANDPLLFIESIPSPETRIFVERVLTNYWIYRLKYGQSTDSLKKVAEGDWPLYVTE